MANKTGLFDPSIKVEAKIDITIKNPKAALKLKRRGRSRGGNSVNVPHMRKDGKMGRLKGSDLFIYWLSRFGFDDELSFNTQDFGTTDLNFEIKGHKWSFRDNPFTFVNEQGDEVHEIQGVVEVDFDPNTPKLATMRVQGVSNPDSSITYFLNYHDPDLEPGKSHPTHDPIIRNGNGIPIISAEGAEDRAHPIQSLVNEFPEELAEELVELWKQVTERLD